jgi:hypothetical protein
VQSPEAKEALKVLNQDYDRQLQEMNQRVCKQNLICTF